MSEDKSTDSPRPLSDTPLDGGIPQVPDAQRGQYRAALLGVFLASRPPLAHALPPWLRPMSLPRSIEAIRELEGEVRARASRVATAELCVGLYARGMPHLRQSVVDLIGQKTAEALFSHKKLEFIDNEYRIKRTVYDLLSDDGAPKPLVEDEWKEPPLEEEPLLEEERVVAKPPRGRPSPKVRRAPVMALPLPVVETDTALDIATMVTTVKARTVGSGDFSKLAKFVDPQSWTYSPFWREAYKVIRVGGRFIKDPSPPPLGTPWEGYFYEYVEWDWNGGVVSSFQNYLNVKFTVTATEINLRYSLYNCRGTMLFARVAEGGIDVDSGGYKANPLPTILPRVSIKASKSLRYTPLVSRSTGNQGTVLTAELLNFMAPGIVGLWIDELVFESTRLWENSP